MLIIIGGGSGRGVEGGDGLLVRSGVSTLWRGLAGKGRSESARGVMERGVVGSLSVEISCPNFGKKFVLFNLFLF